DLAAYLHRVDVAAVELLAAHHDLAVDARARDDLVHAVQRAQEGGLAAAGRADERGHRPGRDRHGDALDGLEVAVVDVEVGDLDALGHDRWFLSGGAGETAGSGGRVSARSWGR